MVVRGPPVVVSDALSKAALFGWTLHAEVSWSVRDLSVTPRLFFIVDSGEISESYSLTWLFSGLIQRFKD